MITGIGIVSPIGIGMEPFWDHLQHGKSGVAKLEILKDFSLPGNIGAEVKDFTEESAKKTYLKDLRKSLKVMCREIQLGVASACMALRESKLDLKTINHERLGIDFGADLMLSPPVNLKDACFACSDEVSHEFQAGEWGQSGLRQMEPLWLLKYLPNMPACHIGIYADARGPNNSITQSEAAGNLAMNEAFHIIERDHADVMIVGSTGSRLVPTKSIHAVMWCEVAPGPDLRCRPFDLNRTGQIAGEGSCTLILEEEAHARARGAEIYGEILGGGSSCVSPARSDDAIRLALGNAMRQALCDANISADQIGHINANGEGAKKRDEQEAQAILDVFGEAGKKIPVTAFKSYWGNAAAGCGVMEITGSLVGLKHGLIPATLGYETPDPACPIHVVHGEHLPTENKVFIKTNVTRMGQASAVVIRGV
ncbi:MAG: beta-ketoacyl-[acyl-carrier-protein] synthase family protein [Planctomycetota bacterium]|nr:beta-ketoacyl-[acyl-carrier-protein] synthase family protein [Planctomycetota bacterium]